MNAQLLTGGWRALYDADKAGQLNFQIVRISRGVPRYWPAAGKFPKISDLMPEGYMLGIQDWEQFGRCYRSKLERLGIDAIQARLDELGDSRPIVLTCFEADRADCHRSIAAAWFEAQTSIAIPEIEIEPDQLDLLDQQPRLTGAQEERDD